MRLPAGQASCFSAATLALGAVVVKGVRDSEHYLSPPYQAGSCICPPAGKPPRFRASHSSPVKVLTTCGPSSSIGALSGLLEEFGRCERLGTADFKRSA
jgi:hypothetical protein